MPISTGMQLVSTSLFGVIVFREWSTPIAITLGVLALIFIIVGIILTSLEDKNDKRGRAKQFEKGHFDSPCFDSWLFGLCSRG